jgi:prepilin peptidase CpaA
MDMPLPFMFSLLGLASFAALVIWAGIGDVRTFMITNRLNLAIAATFLVLCIPMGMDWGAIFNHLKVGVIASLIAMVMFLIGIYGGGDFKMTGAVALWLGPAPIIPFIFYTAIAGGILAIVLIVSRRLAARFGLPASPRWARRMLRRRSAAPYGVALAVGALMAVPRAVWFPTHFFG